MTTACRRSNWSTRSAAAAKTVPFSRDLRNAVRSVGAHLLAAEDLKVQPGDVITYYARARDVGRGKRSTRGEERHVLPGGEAVQRGVRRGAEPGRWAARRAIPQLDSARSPRRRKSSTRPGTSSARSAPGRSADDIEAVAKAQAELKARAERMAGAARGRVSASLPAARRCRRRSGVPREPVRDRSRAAIARDDAARSSSSSTQQTRGRAPARDGGAATGCCRRRPKCAAAR